MSHTSHPRPAYRLSVDGQDINTRLEGRLIQLTLTDNRGFEADQLDIALDDSDGRLALPSRGAEIRLAIGWDDAALIDKGSFTVDEIEHTGAPDQLTIRARSADLRSGLSTQRERSFHATTLGAIVQTIAAENDLVPMISPDLAAKTIEHLDQTNESSANLITRVASQFDAIATVKGGKLLFIHAGAGRSASGQALPAVSITRESGDSHRFSIADREAYTHVRATWHDLDKAEKGEVIWGKDEDTAERARPAPSPAPAKPAGQHKAIAKVAKSRSAALTLARKEWKKVKATPVQRTRHIGVEVTYNDRNLKVQGKVTYGTAQEEEARQAAVKLARRDAEASAARAAPQVAVDHSADNIKTLRHIYASKENAVRAARAEWRRLQRGMAEFSITLARGRPEVFPDLPATVQGFKSAIDNTDWIVAKVTHSLTDNGLTTALELEIRATEIPG